jgi:hypothetical protein
MVASRTPILNLRIFHAIRITLLACIAFTGTAFADRTEPLWVDQDASGNQRVHLYFFWSVTCPHCQEAHPFIEAIPLERPWVTLHVLEVSRSEENARRLEAMAESIGQRAEAVPTFMVCGWMEVGWQDDASSGAALLRAIDACRAGGAGTVVPADQPAIDLPLLGKVDATTLSLPVFTLVIASLDAFNPCAFFVLLFLLSLLANQKDRRRMLTVGAIFIAASGLMYFAFMAAWLNVFQFLGALSWITLGAGILAIFVGAVNIKDFFAFEKGITLSIPESAKPNIYRRARAILQSERTLPMLAATVFLAIAANFYELLCTAGFPMVYTRILTLHEPSESARYAWLALYNVIYVVPLTLIVLAFVGTLATHKLTEREGRLLKLMSGAMMLELGLVLAIVPHWLNSLVVTAALLAIALGITFVAARLTRASGTA